MSKVIEIRSQEQFEQLLRSSKIVLTDCMLPLSNSHISITNVTIVWAEWLEQLRIP